MPHDTDEFFDAEVASLIANELALDVSQSHYGGATHLVWVNGGARRAPGEWTVRTTDAATYDRGSIADPGSDRVAFDPGLRGGAPILPNASSLAAIATAAQASAALGDFAAVAGLVDMAHGLGVSVGSIAAAASGFSSGQIAAPVTPDWNGRPGHVDVGPWDLVAAPGPGTPPLAGRSYVPDTPGHTNDNRAWSDAGRANRESYGMRNGLPPLVPPGAHDMPSQSEIDEEARVFLGLPPGSQYDHDAHVWVLPDGSRYDNTTGVTTPPPPPEEEEPETQTPNQQGPSVPDPGPTSPAPTPPATGSPPPTTSEPGDPDSGGVPGIDIRGVLPGILLGPSVGFTPTFTGGPGANYGPEAQASATGGPRLVVGGLNDAPSRAGVTQRAAIAALRRVTYSPNPGKNPGGR